MLRNAWFIARHDLRLMLSQKETILWVFVMPGLFFYFIGTITGGLGGDGVSRDQPLPVAVWAPADAGFVADAILERVTAEGFEIERVYSEAVLDGRRRILRLPTPDGRSFTAAVLAGEPQTVSFRPGSSEQSGDLEQLRVARAVYGVLADLVAAGELHEETGPDQMAAIAAMPRSLTLEVETAGTRQEIPTGFEQAIPGTMVMFTMLVLLTSGGVSLLIERREGLLRRLAATPISRLGIVSGKWIARMALGLVQVGFAMLLGSLLFGMRWGESLPMVVLILIAWAGLNASLGILVGNLARTEGQCVGIGVLSANVLAALGGCWWPIEVTPEWMQSFASLLPTGWTMDAMHQLVSFGHPATAATGHLAILVTATVLTTAVAARTFRYE